ncbi:hypothetical protein [Aquimarina sp. RZ0]|uniref:hypothetical protein n=1 Tax=Aquimarina sp. RZ0 TaxID=2607730 RepID=UPI0011F26F9E|nr:hypothetical protein [Aquimarina sp. RZ0]KAA1244008.1 hypothetical protein F0000_18410 [Aquimarina sp. RZ0]
MKRFTLVLFSACFILQTNAQDVYEDAMTAASYAYSHSKKAHSANNVFHTQEYADKAAEAFEKVENLADKCGCSEANETAYEAKTNMINSLEEDTYERSRFYAKQAKELGPKLLEQLTDCQSNNTPYTEDIAIADDINEATEEVLIKQQELEEKKRQLEIEQKKLEQQIAEQKKAKAAFEAERAAELKEQAIIKTKAELALQKLENALQELSIAFDNDSLFETQKDYVRSENELKNETLDDTKNFYVNRAKELTKSAMLQFASFNDN